MSNLFQGEIDPEIAALLNMGSAFSGTPHPADKAGGADRAASPIPDFASLFNNAVPASPAFEGPEEIDTVDRKPEIDLSVQKFPEITKDLEETPHTFFNDPNYYKIALANEGDKAQRVHGILQKFINAKDPKDKGVFRQQLITAYWDFLSGIVRNATGKLPPPKRFLLRFGLLHPGFIGAEERTFFTKIVVENELAQPVYYLDEWFKGIGNGTIRASSTDEAKVSRSNDQSRFRQLLEKAMGKREGTKSLLKAKDNERLQMERALVERTGQLADHYPLDDFPEIHSCYTDIQKRIFGEIQELLKQLARADRELDIFFKEFTQADQDVRVLREKVESEGVEEETDFQAVAAEFGTVRQMAKMTIGRQGNHFPILIKDYYHSAPNDVAFRENVIRQLSKIESIDPEVFCRSYKSRLNRIVPYVILIPSYGDFGICWEPFDRFNRATSRSRIAIPMYPKNLIIALLSAVADLRWQVAKEKASFYWMEEGLTGNYYQWFAAQKLKGDVKEYFIQDYIVWMTKESEGIQKLNKEIRGIFWRYMPFARDVKEKLKDRSFVYQELYQRDLNRARSEL
jgi:hypothetical protein